MPGPAVPGPTASGPAAPGPAALGSAAAWDRLRSAAPLLYPPAPCPVAAWMPPTCAVCRGPARPGFARCYQCGRHDLLGHGLLADAVVPVSYAIRGTPFATDLWRYKSGPSPAASAQASVLALLLAFLNDHGACVWQHAAMPPPSRVAVVPTGAGRPGPHPLLRLVSPYLRRPLCPVVLRPGHQGRDLDLGRFRVGGVPAGASVLLLDDTWVSGASAQSAAAALKLAGARHVAVIVLGRHLNPADPTVDGLVTALTPARYDSSACAVHAPPKLFPPNRSADGADARQPRSDAH